MEPNKSILSRFDTVNSTGLILRIKSIIYDLMFDHIYIYIYICYVNFVALFLKRYSSLTMLGYHLAVPSVLKL